MTSPSAEPKLLPVEDSAARHRAGKHIPNALSLSRIALGILFFFLIRQDRLLFSALSLAVMVASLLTDYFDGTLARRKGTVSAAGKWIDPFSDFAFFFFVYYSFHRLGIMPLLLLVLFLVRELSMYLVVRPLTVALRMDPGAKTPGKIKTVCQITGSITVIVALMARQLGLISPRLLGTGTLVLLSLLVGISLTSLYWYLKPVVGRLVTAAPGRPQEAGGSEVRTIRLIVSSVLVFLAAQCLYMGLVAWIFGVYPGRAFLFLGLAAAYHGLFLLGLLLVRREFVLADSGRPLSRLNVPLVLSFARFTSVPTVLFLMVSLKEVPVGTVVIPFLAVIFLTDLFDGLLARRWHQTTRIGRVLDSSGDYLIIVVISILYLIYRMIPVWLFVLVLARLCLQAAGIITLYLANGYSSLKVSFLGKASVFATFVLYGFELLERLGVPVLGSSVVVMVLEYLAGALILVSLAEKLFFLRREFSPGARTHHRR